MKLYKSYIYQMITLITSMSFSSLKTLLWLLISPFFLLAVWLYFWAAGRRQWWSVLLFPFGLVLLLIFITAKVEDPEGPF